MQFCKIQEFLHFHNHKHRFLLANLFNQKWIPFKQAQDFVVLVLPWHNLFIGICIISTISFFLGRVFMGFSPRTLAAEISYFNVSFYSIGEGCQSSIHSFKIFFLHFQNWHLGKTPCRCQPSLDFKGFLFSSWLFLLSENRLLVVKTWFCSERPPPSII